MLDKHCEPHSFDTSKPNAARLYDYLLGGKDNYAADREAAEELLKAVPDAARAARQNRAFLGRAVQFLARDAGIQQFIDIGTGLPTRANVHEIAQKSVPDARVLYVDNDPVVVVHAQALLADDASTVAINQDLRKPDQILTHPALRALIDLDKPVAILLAAVLHFIPDTEDPYAIAGTLKEPMAPGSYLLVSHVTGDDVSPEAAEQARKIYENTSTPGVMRPHAEIACFFDGLEIIPPGLVNASSWRADNSPLPRRPTRTIFYAGVGRKEGTP
jgi:O-methyltransferase involved in polyketide biosynthesis